MINERILHDTVNNIVTDCVSVCVCSSIAYTIGAAMRRLL